MKKAIVGKKIGTVIEAGPCTVVQKKTVETDGYEAVQVGFGALTENRAKKVLNKPEAGHFKKAGVAPMRTLREFRFDDCSGYNVGDELKADQFAAGDKIDITGTSKGHGFTGAIQRWNQHTGPMAHGSKYHRVTIQNLEIVQVDAERNLLLVKGAVPGPNGGLLIVRNSCKA